MRNPSIQVDQKIKVTFLYVFNIYITSQTSNFIIKNINEFKERIRETFKHQKESDKVD